MTNTSITNQLYYGDCLAVMQSMPAGVVDLIYLDPPFNSKRAYNAIYKEETGYPLPDQIEAFCDTWQFDSASQKALKEVPEAMLEANIGGDFVKFWGLWMQTLKQSDSEMAAYLIYMTERLLGMKRVLKDTGSIYLHCDPTASHYIKIIMDGLFGKDNFLNEIVWGYKTGGVSENWFGRKHDTILFYKKGKRYTFHEQKEISYNRTLPEPHTQSGKKLGVERDEIGKYRMVTTRDWWVEYGLNQNADIAPLRRNNTERMSYPTQKPVALLTRIIQASSNKGDLVMDPFCGCATTIVAAHKLNRQWIGIDIAIHAIKRVTRVRLTERLGLIEDKSFTITGIPRNFEGAKELWQRDTYSFQKWAVEQVDGFVTAKKTDDGGVDGSIYFWKDGNKELGRMVLEVKGGKNVGIDVVRNLRGVLENSQADMAGLIILHPFGDRQFANVKKLMAEAEFLSANGNSYSRMQCLTIGEILDGKRFHTPNAVGKGVAQPVITGIGDASHPG